MSKTLSRRSVLQASLGAAVGVHCFPGPATFADTPNERLNIAGVGVTRRAAADLKGVESQNIVAICDIDAKLLEQGAARYPNARKYRDFRQMLEKEAPKIDAVVVGTPDHTHAPAAAMAMRLGKHVYCEKPLTHTIFESRVLAKLAEKHKLVTQMGTQIHAGDNYRQVVELIRAGAIGKVREAHVYVGVDYSGAMLTTGAEAPPNVDWDLWLGPAPERPYSDGVHPFKWRWFWDYGSGGLGDFGCHYIDLVHWALDLKHPVSCEANGPPVDPVATTSGLQVKWEYPARGEMPPVTLHWHDGDRKPEIWSKLRKKDGSPLNWGNGQLFVGEKGMILSNYSRHVLLPADKFESYQRPEPTIPRSVGHHREWIEACKTGGETTCNFDYSGALTESVLLGVVAYRVGKPLKWDAETLRAVGTPEAEKYIHKEYRKGWLL